MNNLTQQFILEQGNTFAEAINDGILEQCNQFMISFLNLPTTYVDGNGDTYPTGFNQSYAWTLDAGYILQTNSSIDNGTIVHEMSIYKKTLSKYFKIKTTYSTNCEPCEAPVVRPQPQNTVAVPLETQIETPSVEEVQDISAVQEVESAVKSSEGNTEIGLADEIFDTPLTSPTDSLASGDVTPETTTEASSN